jgi:hypothetical protein
MNRTYSAILLLAWTVFVVPSHAHADIGFEFSGQGIPRESKQDCQISGQELVKKLEAKGFKEVQGPNCDMEMSGTFGGFVPVLKAKSSRKFELQNDMGGFRTSKEDCERDLKELASKAGKAEIVESACRKGNDFDISGKAIPVFQAWITKLSSIEASPSTYGVKEEADLRRAKTVVNPQANSSAKDVTGFQNDVR